MVTSDRFVDAGEAVEQQVLDAIAVQQRLDALAQRAGGMREFPGEPNRRDAIPFGKPADNSKNGGDHVHVLMRVQVVDPHPGGEHPVDLGTEFVLDPGGRRIDGARRISQT